MGEQTSHPQTRDQVFGSGGKRREPSTGRVLISAQDFNSVPQSSTIHNTYYYCFSLNQ